MIEASQLQRSRSGMRAGDWRPQNKANMARIGACIPGEPASGQSTKPFQPKCLGESSPLPAASTTAFAVQENPAFQSPPGTEP